MNKRLSGLLTMSAVLFAGSAIASNANAVESKTSLAMVSQDNASHIDRVLGELSRQHNGASSLVKSARQPTSLALSSPLLASDTAQVSNDGVYGIMAMNQIELSMQRMPEIKLDSHPFIFEFFCQTTQCLLIIVVRNPNDQLVTKSRCKFGLELCSHLLSHCLICLGNTELRPKHIFRRCLHANQQSARLLGLRRPMLNMLLQILPSAQIEVSNTEVCAV